MPRKPRIDSAGISEAEAITSKEQLILHDYYYTLI